MTATELRDRLMELTASGELDIEITNVLRLSDLTDRYIAPDRARALLTAAAEAVVVALAAFGFYGTQRYLVAAGRREYAIRAAAGAGPRALGRLVARRALAMSAPGIAFGTVLAFVLVAWLRDDLISRAVSPLAVALLVLAGMGGVLLASSLGPARQAQRTAPAPLLREE